MNTTIQYYKALACYSLGDFCWEIGFYWLYRCLIIKAMWFDSMIDNRVWKTRSNKNS